MDFSEVVETAGDLVEVTVVLSEYHSAEKSVEGSVDWTVSLLAENWVVV